MIRHCRRIYHPHFLTTRHFIAAKEAGLPIPAEHPIIVEQIAIGDQAEPIQTALASVGEVDKGTLITQLTEVLPVLDPTTVWIPLVGGAILLRSIHCVTSRVGLVRKLQKSLPYSSWFHQKRVEFLYWRDCQNPDQMREIRSSIEKFCADKRVSGSPHKSRKSSLISALLLAGLNLGLLHTYSLVYADPLSATPFLWIPNLLESDPFYILPFLNIGLCLANLRLLNNTGVSLPTNMMSNKISFKKSPIATIISYSVVCCLVAWPVVAFLPEFQSLYFVFWTTSNITGFLITYSILKFDFIRWIFGIVPKEEFRYLLSHDISLNPDSIEEEKKLMHEKIELSKEQEKQFSEEHERAASME